MMRPFLSKGRGQRERCRGTGKKAVWGDWLWGKTKAESDLRAQNSCLDLRGAESGQVSRWETAFLAFPDLPYLYFCQERKNNNDAVKSPVLSSI